jgi:competence protein ComEC
MNILEFPLARITMWFVCGLLFAAFVSIPFEVTAWTIAFVFLLFTIFFIASNRQFRQKLHFGTIIFLLSFFVGVATAEIHNGRRVKSHYIHNIRSDAQESVLLVTIREKLKSNNFSHRFVAIVEMMDNKPVCGKILLNFKREESTSIFVGSQLLVRGLVSKHRSPMNPNQFDYGKYLENKSIFAQVYLDQTKMGKHRQIIIKDIWYYSDRFRNRIINNLRQKGFRSEELQVANALILGQQQEISTKVVRDYQYAGAVHILSVSGLHVGFVLLFLNFILKPLPQSKHWRFLKLVLILFSLWGFAFIAGMSPSVVRSTTMFSFLAIGLAMRRSTNIFHTLLVSLLAILFFEPSFLFDVGFQLSYTALFFILWLQPALSRLWIPKYKIIKYFWDILTVSFAAQIGALPLSIYYFHQFPGLFFVTNLIVIPLVSIIMVLGVLVMLAAAFGFVPAFPLKLFEFLIHLMNLAIKKVASAETFIIKDIPFNNVMLAALYLAIITTVFWAFKPAYNRFAATLCAIIFFQLSIFSSLWMAQREQELIILNIKRNTVLAERNGREVRLCQKQKGELTVFPYLMATFSSVKRSLPLRNVLYFENTKILVMDSIPVFLKGAQEDILVLTNSPRINLDRYFLIRKPKVVIADGSNFRSYTARWETTCRKQKIPFHNTSEKGFYKLRK